MSGWELVPTEQLPLCYSAPTWYVEVTATHIHPCFVKGALFKPFPSAMLLLLLPAKKCVYLVLAASISTLVRHLSCELLVFVLHCCSVYAGRGVFLSWQIRTFSAYLFPKDSSFHQGRDSPHQAKYELCKQVCLVNLVSAVLIHLEVWLSLPGSYAILSFGRWGSLKTNYCKCVACKTKTTSCRKPKLYGGSAVGVYLWICHIAQSNLLLFLI